MKSTRSCDFSFEDARIWPLKGGCFSTLGKTCGIPLRTELTDFINGRELQSPPSDEDLEFLDNVNPLVHDSEVYCPNEGNGVVDSWVLQQTSSLANMLDSRGFGGNQKRSSQSQRISSWFPDLKTAKTIGNRFFLYRFNLMLMVLGGFSGG